MRRVALLMISGTICIAVTAMLSMSHDRTRLHSHLRPEFQNTVRTVLKAIDRCALIKTSAVVYGFCKLEADRLYDALQPSSPFEWNAAFVILNYQAASEAYERDPNPETLERYQRAFHDAVIYY